MKAKDFKKIGLGDKQSENLEKALQDSLNESVEDARFLASFGIQNLGIGDSRKLLAVFPLKDLHSITAKKMEAIPGFGSKTSASISKSILKLWPTINHMINLGFSLIPTPLVAEQEALVASSKNPFAGKKILFTGTMEHGTRSAMKTQARGFGATILSSVSSKIEFLIIGPDGRPDKISKAKSYGATVLTEQEYYDLIKDIED